MINLKASLFRSLSFENAVTVFKARGFRVEPGPTPEEVTLILDAQDHRTYCVYPARVLTELAIIALPFKFMNGTLCQAPTQLRQH